MPDNDKAFILLNRFCSYDWSRTSVWKIISNEFWKEYLSASMFFIPYSITRISQPLLIREILLDIMNKQQSSAKIYIFAVLYMICNLFTALFARQNIFRSTRIAVRIRNALVVFLFKCSLSMKLTAWKQINKYWTNYQFSY